MPSKKKTAKKKTAKKTAARDFDEVDYEEVIEHDMTKYSYNKEDDTYIIFCPSQGGNVIVERATVESMLEAYSNFDGQQSSINEIARNFNISRSVFNDIKKSMQWTHDKIPLTDEQLQNRDRSTNIESLIRKEECAVQQGYLKDLWNKRHKQSDLYDKLKDKLFNPYMEFLETWTPPVRKSILKVKPFKANKKKKPKTVMVALRDTHYGKGHLNDDQYLHKPWTVEDQENAMTKYLEGITEDFAERQYNIKEIVVASVGDILDSMRGETDKGTILDTLQLGSDQFTTAFNSMTMFFEGLLVLFPKQPIRVQAVSGNHDSNGDWLLFTALQAYFNKTTRIAWNLGTPNEKVKTFKIDNNFFVMEHGYSPTVHRAKVPNSGTPRESYIQKLFMNAAPEGSMEANSRYFIMGDQHHVEHEEYAFFEFLMFPAIGVGGKYEDHHAYKSKKRQNVLVFDENNLTDIMYYYFDK